jgi:hypothetical protein
MSIVQWIVSLLIPAVAGLGGVALGAWLTARNERRRRRFEFIEKQLQDLYSPLLSIRKRIRALSELRVRVGVEAQTVWQTLCEKARQQGGAQALQQLSAERSAQFTAIVEYENEQFKSGLLPAYKQMLDIFREKFWLAEDATRGHFQELIVFIELWDRHLNETIPGEVIARLEVNEARLTPLYDDLEQTFTVLRRNLSSGKI